MLAYLDSGTEDTTARGTGFCAPGLGSSHFLVRSLCLCGLPPLVQYCFHRKRDDKRLTFQWFLITTVKLPEVENLLKSLIKSQMSPIIKKTLWECPMGKCAIWSARFIREERVRYVQHASIAEYQRVITNFEMLWIPLSNADHTHAHTLSWLSILYMLPHSARKFPFQTRMPFFVPSVFPLPQDKTLPFLSIKHLTFRFAFKETVALNLKISRGMGWCEFDLSLP